VVTAFSRVAKILLGVYTIYVIISICVLLTNLPDDVYATLVKMAVKDIALSLNITPGSCRVRLFRIRKTIEDTVKKIFKT